MSLLATHDLAIGYNPDQTLQKDLNFSIEKGEIISLMGQNGVGKTTFLKTLNGLLPPLAGKVTLGQENMVAMNRVEIAKRLAVVLTEKPIINNLSVIELIGLGRHPYSNWLGLLSQEDQDAIEKAIEDTKINYIASKKLHEISDGQFQKVMIARALAQDTDLIVMDEPVAHLDLNNKIEVMLLLKKIAAQGKSILISTHDIQISTQLSDKMWLFNFNNPVQSGLPEDLIINGALKNALYLEHHPYDMIHHRLKQNTPGPNIELSGENEIVYWTRQALERAGFSIGTSNLKISCKHLNWCFGENEFSSIAALLEGVRRQTYLDKG